MARAPARNSLVEFAPAKVNLTLRVLRRRPDGYHELESLVAFARVGDLLRLAVGDDLALSTAGATAGAAGADADNLVLKAARALRDGVENLIVGHFHLNKRLPVAAGLGGGSADAAAALRLLARVNDIPLDDRRLMEAAKVTGADVPVCLVSLPRVMRGIGDVLSEKIALATLPALLVNPGVAVPTKDVFAALRLRSGALPVLPDAAHRSMETWELIRDGSNDLEPAAIAIEPLIAETLATLHALPGCQLARMSGSGATCFALFGSSRKAAAAARQLRAGRPSWWVRATVLG